MKLPPCFTLAATTLDAPNAHKLARFYQGLQWPSTRAGQQTMMHLDIEVNDLSSAVERALALVRLSRTSSLRVLLRKARSGFAQPWFAAGWFMHSDLPAPYLRRLQSTALFAVADI